MSKKAIMCLLLELFMLLFSLEVSAQGVTKQPSWTIR